MPPKPKLHKSSGKSGINNTTPQCTSNSSSSSNHSTSSGLDPEVQQQFEIELLWCIQQLQASLNSGKLNQKQIQESTKTLNGLMSNSAPIIKKRQLMRLTFGDYRAKMAVDEKKLSKAAQNMKIASASPNKKSSFIKKSSFAATSNNFKFNFDVNNVADDISKVHIQTDDDKSESNHENFHFSPSNNAFKFNFSTEES